MLWQQYQSDKWFQQEPTKDKDKKNPVEFIDEEEEPPLYEFLKKDQSTQTDEIN